MQRLKRFFRSLWFLSRVRVKYLLIILVGVTPLLMLTCNTLIDPVSVSAIRGDEDIQPLLEQTETDIEDAISVREQSQPLVIGLAELAMHPYEAERYARALRHESSELTEGVVSELQQLSTLRSIVDEASRALAVHPENSKNAPALPEDPAERTKGQREMAEALAKKLASGRKAIEDLHQSIAKAEEDGLPGTDGLNGIVQTRLDEFDSYIRLNDARIGFFDRDYDGCIAKLQEGDWDGTLRTEADKLQRRAEFRKKGEQLALEAKRILQSTSRISLRDSWQKTIAEIDSLFKAFPAPPHEDDQALHTQLSSDHQLLQGYYIIDVEIPRLPTLPERIQALHDAVRQFPVIELETYAKQQLTEWLRMGLVEKTSPKVESKILRNISYEIQEAETSNGALYVGVFEDKGVYYAYWRSIEECERNPRGYRTIPKNDVVRGPGELTPVTCVKSYVDARKALERDFQDKAAWERFAEECDSLHRKMVEYAREGGAEMGVTFQDEFNFARDVTGVWGELVQPLLTR